MFGTAIRRDVLNRLHFKYCLGHDGRPGAKRDGYFHLWLNRIRIYRERESILANLDRELPRVVPTGFTWHKPDRAFNIGCEFDYPEDLSRLPDILLSRLRRPNLRRTSHSDADN